jgi:hypothetical protein
MPGWQCYFVSNDRVVGCIGQTGLIASKLSHVETFTESKEWMEKALYALSMLDEEQLESAEEVLDALKRLRSVEVEREPNEKA